MLFHVFRHGSLNGALPDILGAPLADLDAAQRAGRSFADVGADHGRSLEHQREELTRWLTLRQEPQ